MSKAIISSSGCNQCMLYIYSTQTVYISIRGIANILNRFQMTVYSMLFDQEVYTETVPSGQVVSNVIDLDILNDTDNL